MQIKTTILIPEPTFKQLKYYSAQKNRSMSSIVAEAVEEKIGITVRDKRKVRQKFTTYNLGPDVNLSRNAIYEDHLQQKLGH